MARGHDSADRRAPPDEGSEHHEDDEREEGEGSPSRPQAELRWVQIREPLDAVEIGRNGRVLASKYHEQWDAWEVLLETYEGELSE